MRIGVDPANTTNRSYKQTGRVATSEVADGPALFILSPQQPPCPGTDVTSATRDWRQEGRPGLAG